MLSTSSPRVEDSQAASKLVAFMGELTAPLLPERERYELLVLFSLMSGLAFAQPKTPHRRAALCSDGTPLEMSLALDDQGRHAIRFVCDVAAGMPDTAASQRLWFRDVADKVVPRFEGSRDTLDRLFEMHLSGAPDSPRFRVWFGAAAAPGSPHTGILYFNTEWLSTAHVIDILTPYLRTIDTAMLLSWPRACGEDYKCIAYDFDASGLRKMKLYLRPDVVGARKLGALLKHFPGDAGQRLLRLFEEGFGVSTRAQRGSFLLGFGLPVQSSTVETTVYFHLESWGIENFDMLTPVLRRLLSDWGFDLDSSLSAGPRGCAPTLLALSVSDQRQRLAVYFKPLLAERQAPAFAATGLATAPANS